MPEGEFAQNNRVAQLHEEILRALQEVSGVSNAGLTSTLPMASEGYFDDLLEVAEFPVAPGQNPPGRRFKWITPGYLETLGVPLLAGRILTWNDVHNAASVVLVNESMARSYWAEPHLALGKWIRESLDDYPREIVGVVGNVRDDGLSFDVQPTVFWPTIVANMWGQRLFAHRSMVYLIRVKRPDRKALMDQLRATVSTINPNLAWPTWRVWMRS